MNKELLRKLQLQAGGSHYPDINPQIQAKFAELIVAECLQYLKDEAERLYMLEDEDADMLAEKCYDNIQGLQDHFGVEE